MENIFYEMAWDDLGLGPLRDIPSPEEIANSRSQRMAELLEKIVIANHLAAMWTYEWELLKLEEDQ